jgi:hypothetical protein
MTDITVEDSATVDASDVADENLGESGLDASTSEGGGLVGDITARRSVKRPETGNPSTRG